MWIHKIFKFRVIGSQNVFEADTRSFTKFHSDKTNKLSRTFVIMFTKWNTSFYTKCFVSYWCTYLLCHSTRQVHLDGTSYCLRTGIYFFSLSYLNMFTKQYICDTAYKQIICNIGFMIIDRFMGVQQEKPDIPIQTIEFYIILFYNIYFLFLCIKLNNFRIIET